MVDYLRRCALVARRSRARRSRRCCTRSCRRRTSTTRIPTPSSRSPRRPTAGELADEDVRRRGRLARLPAARLRHVEADRRAPRGAPAARAPSCSRSTASSPGARRAPRATAARSSSSRAPPRRSRGPATAASGSAARGPTPLDDQDASDLLAAALPALRGALLADAAGVVLEVDRSPEAVAFASSARAPEVSQIGAPCPDHLIHTKHRPLVVDFDPARDGADELRAALVDGVAGYAAWYRDYYERNLTDESRPFPIDPAGPRVVLVPGVGIVTSGADAARARMARDLYHRAIAVAGRGRRGGRLPLAERERGVRDRVLAARALQAGAAPPPRRARRADRARHRRGERDRPRDRAPPRRARRARRRRRPQRRRRRARRRRAPRRATATRRALGRPGRRHRARTRSPR